MIAAIYPKESRARVMGIWNAAIPIGAAVGFLAGGIIGKHWGWAAAFGLVSIPGFVLAVLFWFIRDYQTVRLDDPQGMSQAALGGHRGFFQQALELFRIRSLWFTYLGFAMNTFITTAVMTWLPSYFHRYKGFPMDKAGAMTAVVALAVLVGAPLGGFLADHWMKRRANARMTLSAITSVLSGVLLFLAFFLGQTSFFLPLLILFGVVAVGYVAPSAAVTQDVVHPGLRALSYGLCVVLQHVLGGAWSPMIVGALSDSFGLAEAMLIIPVFALLAALFLWTGSRTYAADAARAKQVELEAERVKNGGMVNIAGQNGR
jgi:MFS family permease